MVLVIATAGAAYIVGTSGFGAERLRLAAERSIEGLLGSDLSASFGAAKLSLDGSRLVALRVADIRLGLQDGTALAEAGHLSLGIRFLPLLSGQVRLGSARLADAKIDMAGLQQGGGAGWTATLLGERGLIEPDLVTRAVFAAVDRLFAALQTGTTRQLELENVEILLAAGSPVASLNVKAAVLTEATANRIEFSAELEADNRALTLAGTAVRDPSSAAIASLTFEAAGSSPASQGAKRLRLGAFDLRLAGSQEAGGPGRLAATLTLDDASLDLGAKNGTLSGDVELVASLLSGSGKLEIDRLHVATGGTRLDYNGAVGPSPESGAAPAYRFELVSAQSALAPADSPEPPLLFASRVAGLYDGSARRLSATEIKLRSREGEAAGTAQIDFVPGQAPGVSLAMSIDGMPVSQVKQLWPWFAGRGARGWTLAHVFAGEIEQGSLRFQVPPGRLGNGIPISGEELWGRVRVTDAQFKTVGDIPAVQQASGSVALMGNSADIALDSGAFVVPGGSVAISKASLKIRNTGRPPVRGELEMELSGPARAVAEVASAMPINALSRTGIVAADLSGAVKGHVAASFPLQKQIDRALLNWQVDLAYTKLTIAKKVSGHRVADAHGTIAVDRDKAVIEAKAKLDGASAELHLVEPLAKDGAGRQRKITMTLDDKTRDAIAPGLSVLVSGPVRLQVDASDNESQKLTADLTAAKLSLPWAGWSKGAGIAATAKFALEKDAGVTRLLGFSLSGKTFSAAGEATLSGGDLASARFGSVKLNRGDSVALSIKRSGKGYAIDVDGAAFDARALIKQFTASSPGSSQHGAATSVKLHAEIGKLTGFNGATLSNLELDFAGSGSRVGALVASAGTASGGSVTIRNTADAGGRKLEVKSGDAGALVRFLDIYDHMEGGSIELALAGERDGPMRGQVDARNFVIVGEPRLASIVSSPAPGDNRSLNQAVKGKIDTSRVTFDRGYAQLSRDTGFLGITNGVLRGQLIGSTFQGTLYDPKGRMSMTGTFMPAYGLNRLFGEIPLLGTILGNGRDRGLIGVTFKLTGEAKSPRLQINPLSVIAPGIFRNIFEF